MAAFLRHITKTWRGYLVAFAIAAGLFLLARESCATRTLTKLETQGVAQDSTLATHKRNLRPTRQHTDSALTPANVEAERDSCDTIVATAGRRIDNLKHQVTLLKPASVALFGQVDYALNDRRALLLAGLQGRVTLPLVGQAQVYGAYSFPGWHVGLRKELRIR